MEVELEELKLQRYDEYKDSGFEWLGEIPKHWSVIKLKFIADVINGDSLNESQKKKFESVDRMNLPYISTKDIDLASASINYDNGLRIPPDNSGMRVARKNSALLCIEGGSAGKKIGFLEENVYFVNKLAAITSKKNIHPKYIYYFAQSTIFKKQFQNSMTGLIGGVSINLIRNFFFFFPLKLEQLAITEFLDRILLKIDRATNIKQQQINLLKERKQILIHKAVTQGLDRSTKLKNSGVEWIGNVPEHWEIARNKSLFKERNENGNPSLPLLSVSIHSAVSSEELNDEDNLRGKIKIEDRSSYKLVEANDIAFNMMRAWQGAIGAVGIKGMVSPAYIVARPIREINSTYFEYLYRTPLFIQQMDRFSKGITDFRKRLYWCEFKNLVTIKPPLEEQLEIIRYIEINNHKVDTAVKFKESEIEKLKEYKKTLINAAVTGKIKVSRS